MHSCTDSRLHAAARWAGVPHGSLWSVEIGDIVSRSPDLGSHRFEEFFGREVTDVAVGRRETRVAERRLQDRERESSSYSLD